MSVHHHVVVVGGGAAGLTVTARLLRALPGLDIAVIDPASEHYYQPMWTLVGGGVFPRQESRRKEADVIPSGAEWIQDGVESFDPVANLLWTRDGLEVSYDYLVVSPGLQINWDGVVGLRESLGKNGVCSNYSYETVESTWENVRNFRGGTALFTHPTGAVKCGGAPQKICYLAEDHFRRSGIRDRCEVVFASAKDAIFDVARYARTLEKAVARKGIDTRFGLELKEIRGDQKQAVFQRIAGGESVTIDYDMVHVTPPMGPPSFVAASPLANEAGWVDVDKHTLRHTRYGNVFGVGDASSLPTSKTAAAIRKQAPVLVENLLAIIDGEPPLASYDGYTSCPVVTGYDSLVLAEFDYDKNPEETFPFDQSQERFSMMMMKEFALPALYWHGMLKGRA
ncbi:Sulfide dehydrogenase [flavocytochrome c] flavoprotein chain precursor [Pseudobythopirellula maris]|uniref:Sulfide dehydrogenase [flavocytochrome c] flavoprotein chain n=1 Tax=Pseudobythopirellula maris TaxID=2527991 RepID=A0A5C5ZNI0_9BACT|nr:FAD/NAD(P)-binding oxidoreductase [Pseudobythopirellula maris]TWT88625.1 Sulfide dehydrogenase [flavocytochrome c] flavoprotein chain precursor [Pseudobythopirellula maris]